MPKQLIRIADAFRGEPRHRHSRCAHDDRVLASLRQRQADLDRRAAPICGDTIAGYTLEDDAITLAFRRGRRLRIEACGGVAAATVTDPPESPLDSLKGAAHDASERLEPACTLLFLPPQRRRPARIPKRKKKRQANHDASAARITNQQDFCTLWRRGELPARLIGRRLIALRAEPISVRLLIENMPGSICFTPLREPSGRWLLWWREDDVRACPGLETMRPPCHRGRDEERIYSTALA